MLRTDMDKALLTGKSEEFGGCGCTAAFLLCTKG